MAKGGIVFEDYSVQVKAAMGEACAAFLEEAGSEVETQAVRNQTRVDTSKTKGAWTHKVDSAAKQVVIGNPEENAIWEEFGTGEYALKGGRKGGWVYRSSKDGKFYRTQGKTPLRPLYKAFQTTKPRIEKALAAKLKELG